MPVIQWTQVVYPSLMLPLLFVIMYVMLKPEDGTQQIPDQTQTNVHRSRLVFADLTSNKLTREHDGSFGMWSYHGIAEKSHASQTEFIYNADLLSNNGSKHLNIASTVYPLMGLTSDMDPQYQEYLILQAKTVGIDGYILEWGYQQHYSNTVLLSLLKLASKKYKPFKLTINWCDHWLTTDMANSSSKQIVDAFHSNIQYLYDNVFSFDPELIPMHGNHPIIFLFGGGLSASQFAEVLEIPLHIPDGLDTPIWIGSFLKFASTPSQLSEWKDLINGTYGWVPNIRRPTPPSMSEWDFYGTTDDIIKYQMNVTAVGTDCTSYIPGCVMWCGSISPGMDNRGCAGWGTHLRYIPRENETTDRMTYDLQWEYYLDSKTHNQQPDMIILATMNDFPEATTILPTENSSFTNLYRTALYTSAWKNSTGGGVTGGVPLPMQWFMMFQEAQFYNRTPKLNASGLFPILETSAVNIGKQDYTGANKTLQIAKQHIAELQQRLTMTAININSSDLSPTLRPIYVDNATLINSTVGLFLALKEDTAALLRSHNYKALLKFEYKLLKPKTSHLIVKSSSKRQSSSESHHTSYIFHGKSTPSGSTYKQLSSSSQHKSYVFHDKNTRLPEPNFKPYTIHPNYAEVCNLVIKEPGVWSRAVVALYKPNQAWDQSGKHASDLHFAADTGFLIRNISISVQLYKVKDYTGR